MNITVFLETSMLIGRTSNFSKSEIIVQEALERLMHGRTTVVVAHHLSTIRNVDSIAVIQDSRIAEQGSHQELSSRNDGLYACLLNLQRHHT